MTQQSRTGEEPDQAAVRQYIRLFGHRPDAVELANYKRARARVMLRLPARLRNGAARVVLRF